jgi:hypothetical protein
LGSAAFSAAYVEEGRGIISDVVLYFTDGTLITGIHGGDSLTDVDGDGLFEVLPGDIIVLPDNSTNEVPVLPGYPNGTPYEYDPSFPAIVGGVPRVTVDLNTGTINTGSPISFDGNDGITGTDDDIVIDASDSDVNIDANGYVVVTGDGAEVKHADDSPLENGDTSVPNGTVIIASNIIVRTGTGTSLPSDNITSTGTIHLVTGNIVDCDGDGQEPWGAPGPGIYNPDTGYFTPDSGANHYPVPPQPGSLQGVDGEPVIESIALDNSFIYLYWTNHPSSGSYLSEIWAKVLITDTNWETLTNGQRGVVVMETNAAIPRALGSIGGGSAGTYLFFRRVVPNHNHPAP